MSAAAWTGRLRRRGAEAAVLALGACTLVACAGGPQPQVQPGANVGGQPSARYGGYKVGKPYQVRGVWYYPKEQPDYDEIGLASWYGYQFHNQYTADGEVFDMTLPSAAHKTLPLPSLVEVTNLANGKTLVVRVNDRGPFVDGRIIDLSKEAAAELGFVAAGVTRVRVRYVGKAPDPPGVISTPPDPNRPQLAQARTQTQTQTPAPRPAPVKAPVAAPPTPAAPIGPSIPEVDSLLASAAPSSISAPTAAPTATPTAAPAAAAVSATTYDLQAGAFATLDQAQKFVSGLGGAGLPEVQPLEQGGQTLYRVVIHGLANSAEAFAARSQALALGALGATIVGGS
jgi:rare lipoprotein A